VATKHTTFRLDDDALATLQGLAEALHISRTEVVRQATSAFRNLILVAQADSIGVLETIRERYGAEAEVTLWVSQGADGEPEAHVRIDDNEPADLGARVITSPEGGRAFVFLDLNDAAADLLVPVGDDALRVRPRFPVGELPWPPQNLRIVLSLKNLAPIVPAEVPARLDFAAKGA
jgi:predicted transcriptional regulator